MFRRRISNTVAAWLVLMPLVALSLPDRASRGAENVDVPAVDSGEIALPEVKESLAEIRLELARQDRRSPEFEAWRLKALILLDAIRQREGVEGLSQAVMEKNVSDIAIVHGDPKKIAWRALTCWNPACLGKGKAGGPVLFVHPLKHASLGLDGKLHWRTLKEKEVSATPPVNCPVCGEPVHVRPYDTPQVELRRKQLTDELEAVRKVRAKAAADGKLVPAGGRTPSEIMRDLSQLPKLYFVPEEK